jgi:NIPSNAP
MLMPSQASIALFRRRSALTTLAAFAAGVLMTATASAQQPPAAQPAAASQPSTAPQGRVFEMRTYYCHPGRLEALQKRFREHTTRLFKKHGMENVGYWVPTDKQDVLVYILAYPSREAATASWAAFRADPEWNTARTASEADGPIVQKVESVYMTATDYSPLK